MLCPESLQPRLATDRAMSAQSVTPLFTPHNNGFLRKRKAEKAHK